MYYIKLILIYAVALIPLVISVLPSLLFYKWGSVSKNNIWLRTILMVASIIALAAGLYVGLFLSYDFVNILMAKFL